MAQVEACGGLVEQQHAWSVRRFSAGDLHQHTREMSALLLAARQRGDHAVVEIAQIDLGERGLDQVVDVRSAAIPAPICTISATVNGKVTPTFCEAPPDEGPARADDMTRARGP